MIQSMKGSSQHPEKDIATALQESRQRLVRLEDVPAGLASQLLLELNLKPVMRELHPPDQLDEARARWEELGYSTVVGEPIMEDQLTGSMVSRHNTEFTIRPLKRHPVVERLVELGGERAEQWLLKPSSPIYQWLTQRFDADQTPERPEEGSRHVTPQRALYLSRRQDDAENARAMDRMAHDAQADQTAALGSLLGYPSCCVKSFSALERRWPNRLPVQDAMKRTRYFHPRLNNLSLNRFTWISWFPCRFDCPESIRLANAAADALAKDNPALVRMIDEQLGKPRVYWADQHQAVLEGVQKVDRATLEFDRLVPLQHRWPGSGEINEDMDNLRPSNQVSLDLVKPVFHAGSQALELAGKPLLLPFGI
jgi:hypothetical protein